MMASTCCQPTSGTLTQLGLAFSASNRTRRRRLDISLLPRGGAPGGRSKKLSEPDRRTPVAHMVQAVRDMNGRLDKIAPGLLAKLNLMFDEAFLTLFVLLSAIGGGPVDGRVLMLSGLGAAAWFFAAAVLRLYSPC